MGKILVMTHNNNRTKIALPVKNSRAAQGGYGRNFNPFVRGKGISNCTIEHSLYTIQRTRAIWSKKMAIWEGLGSKIIQNQ